MCLDTTKTHCWTWQIHQILNNAFIHAVFRFIFHFLFHFRWQTQHHDQLYFIPFKITFSQNIKFILDPKVQSSPLSFYCIHSSVCSTQLYKTSETAYGVVNEVHFEFSYLQWKSVIFSREWRKKATNADKKRNTQKKKLNNREN